MLAYDERTDNEVFKIECPDAEVVLPQLEDDQSRGAIGIEILVAVLVAVMVAFVLTAIGIAVSFF